MMPPAALISSRPKEAGARRQVTDAYVFGLAAHDGGETQCAECGSGSRTLKQTATTTADL